MLLFFIPGVARVARPPTPVPSGEAPAYNGNCTACTGTFNGWYCTATNVCWSILSSCVDTCGTCVAHGAPWTCPGTLPPYNGNCGACTDASEARGWYCTATGTCWAVAAYCSDACAGGQCVRTRAQCPVTPVPRGELPQYNGNCTGCVTAGNAWYCLSTNLCWTNEVCDYACGDYKCTDDPYRC